MDRFYLGSQREPGCTHMRGQQMRSEQPLSTAVVDAVAAREGIDPVELPEPLYHAVNTEALDSLFSDTTGRVTFHYLGYEVTVESSGDIALEPLDST